jgi:hypothetical protein
MNKSSFLQSNFAEKQVIYSEKMLKNNSIILREDADKRRKEIVVNN